MKPPITAAINTAHARKIIADMEAERTGGVSLLGPLPVLDLTKLNQRIAEFELET